MDVEKDIDAIYKRLNNIDKRLVEIESTRPFLKEMVDRNVSICELLGETIDVFIRVLSYAGIILTGSKGISQIEPPHATNHP